MGKLHKRTHRSSALIVLFVLLGVAGWHLPQFGAAAMTYSNRAYQSVQQALVRTMNNNAAPVAAPAKLTAAQGSELNEEIVKQLNELFDQSRNGEEFSREELLILARVGNGDKDIKLVEANALLNRVLYHTFVTKRGLSRELDQVLKDYRSFVTAAGRTIADEAGPGPKGGVANAKSAPTAKSAPAIKNAPAAPAVAITTAFTEGFEIAPPAGWITQNNSSPVGTIGWFQGVPTNFPAHMGPTDSYISANFNNTGSTGTISNWLLTPELALKNGDQIKFWTRTAGTGAFPDRLEVRLSTSGAGTNVGADVNSVGTFTTVLLTVNPNLVAGAGGYPTVFTQFTATISGLGAPTTGRVGFRYFVTDAGLNGANSNLIGIDTFEYAPLQPVVIAGDGFTITNETCGTANNVADPGETITLNLCVRNTGTGNTTNLMGTLLQNPAQGVISPSAPQNYGAVAPGGAGVCRSYSFTVPSNATCGGTVIASLQFADGATSLGTVNYNIAIGTTNAPTTVTNFDNNTAQTLPATGTGATTGAPSSLYPAPISVSGVTGTVIGVKVKLNGLTHTNPDDLDVLLVGPTGANVILMSDAGGTPDVANINITFADGAPYMPDGTTQVTALTSTTYSPTNIAGSDAFPAPAPTASTGGPLNTLFGGLDPNGTWNLFIVDDASTNTGTLTGWSLEFTTTNVAPTVTTTPFTNAAAITIPGTDSGTVGVIDAATPYPSTINVSGVNGAIRNLRVTLNGFSHAFPTDVDMMLVGPTGQSYVLLSDTGTSTTLSNANITVQDGTTIGLAYGNGVTLGPSNSTSGDIFPAPAPAVTKSAPLVGTDSLLSTYGSLNPNGAWSLFIVDDFTGDVGSISGGWTISFTTVSFPTSCMTCAACTLTPPANVTMPADPTLCTAVVNYAAPTTSGTCGAVTCTPASGTAFPKGVTTVSCISATGGGFATFTVTVTDTQAPVITCPANVTVSTATGACTAVVNYSAPTATDNCTGLGTPICVPPSGSTFQKGTTTVNCTVTDGAGLTASCAFTVTVNDTQAPTIACPSNIFTAATGATTPVNFALPTVGDNCPGVQTPVCVPAPGSAFPVGVTTVNCSVRDAVNNTSTCSFQVTVNRVGAPSLSDPLACTGPGNVLSGFFTVTNSGVGSQPVVANVALGPSLPFQQLLALPNTCVVTPNVGTCTVTPAGIAYSATLNAGQSVTVSYSLQVADGVLPGTVLTSTVTASFNGGPVLTAGASTTANCQAAGPGPTHPARSEVSDVKAGSVLVYPIYTSSVAAPTQNTRIALTNTHPNLDAFAHLFFVADTCSVSDAYVCLGPNQTTVFQASDLDPGTTGYLVVVASSRATGCPINFNYLIGDEYVKFTSGHAANLGAEAISAIAGSAFWASCGSNSNSSTLQFDGISYNRLPYVVAVDNIGSRADGNDTMLILNRIGGDLRTGPMGVGNVFGVFYNDTETQLSFTLNSANCQYRFQVNNTVPRITPRFDQFVPAGRSGWMRLYQRDGHALLGSVINFNSNAGSNAGAFSQGHNLHHLTLTDTASYIIPVFPPSC